MTNSNVKNVTDNKTKGNKTMKKAEMEKMIAELQSENQQLKEQINGKKERKFNVWNNTYFQLAKEYLNANKKNTFEITVRHYNDKNFITEDENGNEKEVHIDGSEKVLVYLAKNNILKIGGLTPDIVEGKTVYRILIKDFNINGKLNGKKGEYNPFEYAITRLTA